MSMSTVARLLAALFMLAVASGCNSFVDQTPVTTPDVTLPSSTLDESRWDIYHPDPEHLWNRLFRQLYKRTAKDGREYGWDSLDPLLWPETTHLLEQSTHEATVRLFDEFLSSHGGSLIADPLKRALFQRDMWAVFDWLAYQSMYQTDNYPDQRHALQWRLAQVIQKVALTEEEILSLPENYEMAVRSRAFPATFQVDHPDVAFLPGDLMEPDSGWVCLGRDGGPMAITHTEVFPFFGRAVFLVFIRVPGRNDATLNFLHQLNRGAPTATIPIGTEVALVRRMLLIDTNGDIKLSPIVESVQIRHFSPAQNYYKFGLNRYLLFNGTSGGLRSIGKEFILFLSHGIDLFESDHVMEAQIPGVCTACHGGEVYGTQSIISYSRARFPLPDQKRPVLSETTPEVEAQTSIAWKLNHPTWKSLQTGWR